MLAPGYQFIAIYVDGGHIKGVHRDLWLFPSSFGSYLKFISDLSHHPIS